MLSLKQGGQLVQLARKSIAYYSATSRLLFEKPSEKLFEEKFGVFLSLHSFPKLELKGCIGFPLPVMPLWNACIQAAVSAAFEDSRFLPLKVSELSKTLIEVSVLSKPCILDCPKEELPEKIEIGLDGLIVRKGARSGLLLPVVAAEYKWSAEEFLCQACEKAGLPRQAWKDRNVILQKFHSQLFKEKVPAGNVVEVDLKSLLNE